MVRRKFRQKRVNFVKIDRFFTKKIEKFWPKVAFFDYFLAFFDYFFLSNFDFFFLVYQSNRLKTMFSNLKHKWQYFKVHYWNLIKLILLFVLYHLKFISLYHKFSHPYLIVSEKSSLTKSMRFNTKWCDAREYKI